MPVGTPAFSATGFSEYPDSGGSTGTPSIDPADIVAGTFQTGTYNFPGGLEIAGQPVVVAGGTFNANEVNPGEFQSGTYDFPNVGGLTVAGKPVYTVITANDVLPGSFFGLYNFTQGPTVNNQPVYFRGIGQASGVLGTDIALETVTGGPGSGVGNIRGGSIYGYNIQPGSLDYSLLSGTAQQQVLDFTVADTSFSFLRRVSQLGSLLDSNGKETDGFVTNNGATRVADPQAYNAWAITNSGMAQNVLAVSGPAYAGLRPGSYVVNVFLRVSDNTSTAAVCTVQVTGTGVTGPAIPLKGTDLGTSYVGVAVPFTVTAATNSVSISITNVASSTTLQWWFSHAHADPSTGKATQAAAQYFFANAAITSAQIQNIVADQINSGVINSDNIFLGTGGHVYAGIDGTVPANQHPTGNTPRVEINSGGFFAYDGTQNTVAITPTGATIRGVLTVLAGSNVAASALTGAVPATVSVQGSSVSGAVSSATSATSATSASNVTGGTISGANTISGYMIVGNAGGAHVAIGSGDGKGTNGIRLFASDGTTVMVDLNVSGAATFAGTVKPGTIDFRDANGNGVYITASSMVIYGQNGAKQTMSVTSGDWATLNINGTATFSWTVNVNGNFTANASCIVNSGLTVAAGGMAVTGSAYFNNIIVMNNNNIYLRQSNDPNHVIGYNSGPDGPWIQGYLGGEFVVNSVSNVWVRWYTSSGFFVIGETVHDLSVSWTSGGFGATNYAYTGYKPMYGSGFTNASSQLGKEDITAVSGDWAIDVIRSAPSKRWKYHNVKEEIHRDAQGKIHIKTIEPPKRGPNGELLSAAGDDKWHFGPVWEELHHEVRTDDMRVDLRDMIGVLWAGLQRIADRMDALEAKVAPARLASTP